ncbi:MAG: hypothetical protein ABI556_14185, partial [Gemmatimonadales bacterium]
MKGLLRSHAASHVPTPRPISADALVAKIVDLASTRVFALESLISVSSVQWSSEISTACIECAARPRLLLNPEFVEKHCNTPERLATLVLHELSHVSMGHTRLYPRGGNAHNVAFDAIINRDLSLHFARTGDAEPYTSLFTSYYGESRQPEFVLRPPPGWPELPVWDASVGCDEDLRSIHRRLYDPALLDPRNKQPSLLTYGEIISALERTASGRAAESKHAGGKSPNDAPDISTRLLGGHGISDAERAADSGGRDSRIANALPKLVSEVSVLAEHSKGAGSGGKIETLTLDRVQKERRLELALAVLLKKSFLRQSSGSKRWLEERVPAISVDRSRDRRAGVRHVMSRRLGIPQPLLFNSESTRLRPAPCAAPIYLDVSGSMNGLLERLYAALRPLRRQLLPEMFAFSTVVTPISKADFDAGTIRTTGGTSLQPVIDHVIESSRRSGTRVAVVLTDGYFT